MPEFCERTNAQMTKKKQHSNCGIDTAPPNMPCNSCRGLSLVIFMIMCNCICFRLHLVAVMGLTAWVRMLVYVAVELHLSIYPLPLSLSWAHSMQNNQNESNTHISANIEWCIFTLMLLALSFTLSTLIHCKNKFISLGLREEKNT